MRNVVLSMALLGLAAGGCRGQREAGETPAQADEVDYGALPGLKAAPDRRLRDELARITEEGGTPALLDKTRMAESDNVAAGLAGLFADDKIASILEESEKIFPPGEFEFDPIRLQKAIDFGRRHGARRLQARDAVARSRCDLGIRFIDGLTADLRLMDVVRISARLEAFWAAESLAGNVAPAGAKVARGNGPEEAVEALGSMFRLAECLGAELHPVARLEAAFLRSEAFRVMQAIVRDDQTGREDLDRLYQMVEKQLATWPDDAGAWIGDRALGLHAYEMVRAGDLADLLTPKEIVTFEEEGTLDELLQAAVRNVDQDELYYLQTMRKIIDGCSRPFYERLPLFDAIARDLQEGRNAPEFPVVAAWVLRLPDVRKGHAIQARDRANWEAWALALALATGKSPPQRTNPLSGENYLHAKQENSIIVENFGSGQDGDYPSISVPCRQGAESK